MTLLESTVSMLEMLPDDDLAIVNGVTKRLLVSVSGNTPYSPLTEEEWAKKLDHSLSQVENGDIRDARSVSKELRDTVTVVAIGHHLQDLRNVLH